MPRTCTFVNIWNYFEFNDYLIILFSRFKILHSLIRTRKRLLCNMKFLIESLACMIDRRRENFFKGEWLCYGCVWFSQFFESLQAPVRASSPFSTGPLLFMRLACCNSISGPSIRFTKVFCAATQIFRWKRRKPSNAPGFTTFWLCRDLTLSFWNKPWMLFSRDILKLSSAYF